MSALAMDWDSVSQDVEESNLLIFQAPLLLMLDDSSVSRPIVGNPKDSRICLYPACLSRF